MIPTADLCDAHEEIVVCNARFSSWGARRAFEGRIRTVRCFEDFGLVRQVLAKPGDGCVLVVDGGGSETRAIFGATMAGIAVANRWSGLVFNGVIRDAREIGLMEIGIKALGLYPRRGTSQGTGEIDVPVTIGGALMTPGHWLVADEDGVVVLPKKPE